jgi:nicotinamidase-related amidase
MRTALIVIDMQQGSFTDRSPRHDAEGLVRRLNQLARRIRSADGIVLYVQHDGPPGDPHHPGEPGWRLLPALETGEEDLFIRKRSCDAFLETDLDEVLKASGVGRVIVTGCATDFCVDTTVRSALARRYRTVVPIDGHTTADRPYLSAEKIIEHHNAVWADFISPVGPALLARCSEINV